MHVCKDGVVYDIPLSIITQQLASILDRVNYIRRHSCFSGSCTEPLEEDALHM
jgi:hypothetical protein